LRSSASRKLGGQDLDDEVPAGFEVGGRTLGARHLLVLRGQVRDRGEYEVGEPEGAVDPCPREIADRDPCLLRTRLPAKLFEHRLGDVDAVHGHASPAERERETPLSTQSLGFEIQGRAK
jgi:hypothetical protein